ncbi:MAG: PQQ-binding-like beta-propeller repeat protein [Planctomycetaceae bacterium]|nr:PQQ-binding-like beta-propeller repeat protein [Planctomycetaceae bacterium]
MFRNTLIVLVLSLSCNGRDLSAQDWPTWRGIAQNSVSTEQGLPTEWSETSNLLWKVEIPFFGNNTPIIIGDSLFFTSQDETNSLLLFHVDKNSGKTIWKREIGKDRTPRAGDGKGMRGWQKFHELQNLATPSVAADQEVIIAHFGNGDTAAYDWTGHLLWKKNMQEEYGIYTIWWGNANTPVLYENLMIMIRLNDDCRDFWQEGKISDSFVIAFDKKTGQAAWKTARNIPSDAEYCDAYNTPVLWQHEGRTELIVFGSETLDAYNPQNGERLWWLDKELQGNRVVPTPTLLPDSGVILGVRGKAGAAFAVKPKGLGEQSEEIFLWSESKNTPDVPALISDGKIVLMSSDDGILNCMELMTGSKLWSKRLPSGKYYPTPILSGDGNAYFLNGNGICSVVKMADEFELIAENHLEDQFIASIAVSDGKLYLRGKHFLYCIGKLH